MDKPASFFIIYFRLLTSLWLIVATTAVGYAQDGSISSGGGEFAPEIPASYSGSGSFFNRQLGTAFRFSYHNEGYGTQEGVVTLGTMKVFSQEGSTVFLDGQATLSDEFGGGFNAGVGFRKLSDLGFGSDSRRINGLSFWTDGQSTSADNFFTQLGVAAESLGDSYDLRFQGNFPLDQVKDGDLMEVTGSDVVFAGDALLGSLQQFARDTALTVLDLEGAKRIADLEAWAFLGGYHLTSDGIDATGYRAGVRGYAVPDLSVSLQVTDDDIYHTNVMVGLTWFVGRTHRGNQPCGTLLDRFREPVLRNDFIATTQQLIDNPIDPLTDAVSNEQFVFVHVDSDAPAGGDGTIENPYQTLAEAEAGSGEDDIIFVHSGSTLAGNFDTEDGQRVLGEGLDPNGNFIDHTVNSAEQGLVSLPESSAGSQGITAPTITGVGTVFYLADHTGNEINNFVINGGSTAVSANQADSPQLANLDINNPTGDGISFTDVVGSSLIENSVTIDGAGGKGILVDGGSGVLGANAMITDSTGNAIEIRDRSGGSVTVGEINQAAGGDGIFVHDNSGGTITFSSLAEVTTSGVMSAVELENNTGATITFQELRATSGLADTFVVNGGGTISVNDPNDSAFVSNTGIGSALVVRGDADPDATGATGDPSLTILANITNTGGDQAVDIQGMTGGAVSITGNVDDSDGAGDGIVIEDNTGGTFSFAGATTLNTGGNGAVALRNNTGASVTFSTLNATAAGGNTFVVEGGGTVTVNDPNDTGLIENTGSGSALIVVGDDFAPGIGNPTVNIASDIANSGGGEAVDIQDMTGGGVTITGDVSDTNADSNGILVRNNTAGTFAFQGNTNLDTGALEAVRLLNNDGASISFSNLNATAAAGDTFVVEGGGSVTVNDPNNTALIANTGSGSALIVTGDDSIAGIGNPTVTIASDTVNSGGGEAVDIQDMTGGGVTITGDVSDPNSDGMGILVEDNSAGSYLFTGTTTLDTGGSNAVTLRNNDGATISFGNLNATAAGGNTFVVEGGGMITVSDPNDTGLIENTGAGTALFVQGDEAGPGDFDGDPTLTVSVDIDNTSGGRVASIRRLTGGSVNLNGAITDDIGGVLIEDNPGGTINVNGMVTLDTGANDALTIQSNGSGNTVDFNPVSQLDIDTTSGTGIVINGPGTVTIEGTGNTVDTTTAGVGIDVTNAGDTTINNATVNTAGAANAVNISHTSADDSAITFNDLTVASAGVRGVNVSSDGAGSFGLLIDDANIDNVGQEGVFYDLGADAIRSDFTLTDSTVTAGDDQAFLAMVNDTLAVGSDVRFLIDDNEFNNASATDATVEIFVDDFATLSATIGDNGATEDPPASNLLGNDFNNISAGASSFLIDVLDTDATINLDLRANRALGGAPTFELQRTAAGTFRLVDSADTIGDMNNQGAVNDDPGIIDTDPPLLMPTLP